MDRQREIFEFYASIFNERFKSNMIVVNENIGTQKSGLSKEQLKVLDVFTKLLVESMQSQNEAICGALSETLVRFIKPD